MKKTFAIFIIYIILLKYANAQKKELEFNEVKLITLSGPTLTDCGISATQSITIPAGKIWKIESSTVYGSSNQVLGNPSANNPSITLLINNILLAYTYGSGVEKIHFPIWLPEGTYLIKLYQYTCLDFSANVNDKLNGQISAIEFNVVIY